MTEQNVTPPAPAAYDNSNEELHVQAGEGMELGQELPPKEDVTPKAEETAPKNEVNATATPEKVEAVGEAEHSSKTISELGEDRKRLASELIDLARTSETATNKVKELMEKDPRMERLIKTKFGSDYDRIMAGEVPAKAATVEPVDIEKIKEQARVEARAEVIMQEAENTRQTQLTKFAQSNGLNSEEADQLKENSELLEAKFGFEKALEMSLLIVNKDKANASKGTVKLPSGGQEIGQPPKKVGATPELEATVRKYGLGRSAQQVAEGLQRVEERFKDGTFHLGD